MASDFASYDFRRKKSWTVYVFVVVVTGLTLSYLLYYLRDLQILFGIGLGASNLLACYWARNDSIEHETLMGFGWGFMLLIAAPLSLPMYLVARYGSEGINDIFMVILLMALGVGMAYGIFWVIDRQELWQGVWDTIRPYEPGDLDL